MRWRENGRNKQISAKEARGLETKRFKGRTELLSFAGSHPGALSGGFLCMIYDKLNNRAPRETKELRSAKVSEWASKFSGLSELRDRREVQTLAHLMDLMSRRDYEVVMDVIAQRITSIQEAKKKGGSWEKAQHGELLPMEGHSGAPSGMTRLYA